MGEVGKTGVGSGIKERFWGRREGQAHRPALAPAHEADQLLWLHGRASREPTLQANKSTLTSCSHAQAKQDGSLCQPCLSSKWTLLIQATRGDSTLPTPGAPSLCEAPQGEWGANVSLQADPFQPACIVLRSVGQVP